MKAMSAELRALFDSGQLLAMADLLTLTPVGAAAVRLTSHDQDLSFGGQTWQASGAQPHSDRHYLRLRGTSSGGSNPYTYRRILLGSLTVLPTDILSYEVWGEISNPAQVMGVDFLTADGQLFRERGITDQNGVAWADIGARAQGQWYARRFSLASMAGKRITEWALALEGDPAGAYTALFANVVITDAAGNVRLPVFTTAAAPGAIAAPVFTGAGDNLYTAVSLEAVPPTRNPLFRRTGTHVVRGVEVDTNDLTFMADQLSTLLGTAFIPFAARGGLDGAAVLLERAYARDWSQPIVGVLHQFSGRVSTVQGKRNTLRLTQKSALEVLDVQSPRNEYQPACLNTLFDSACGLLKAAFTQPKTAGTGSTISRVTASISEPDGWFDQGTLTFTAGANAGISRTIKRQAAGALDLILPLPAAPVAGDAFALTPGCNKAQGTCSSKFNNLLRFRGFPYIPKAETATTAPNVTQPARPVSGGGRGGGSTRSRVVLN